MNNGKKGIRFNSASKVTSYLARYTISLKFNFHISYRQLQIEVTCESFVQAMQGMCNKLSGEYVFYLFSDKRTRSLTTEFTAGTKSRSSSQIYRKGNRRTRTR